MTPTYLVPHMGEPTRADNGDGTFTYTWENPSLNFTIRVDPLMPEGWIMACQTVRAERDGKVFETLPPSAVMERERLRRQAT